MSTHTLSTPPSIPSHSLAFQLINHSSLTFLSSPTFTIRSSAKDSSISSITLLTSKNYCSWANDMKSWLQLNGLWHLVSGLERKPVGRAEVKDAHGNVVTPAADVDEDKLEHWEIKAKRTAGALKTAMSPDVKVLIRDGKDDPIFIWDTLKTSFIQQRTAPCFNAYHALLSVQKLDSESLEGLINRVDEHIRIIKSLSPSSFTMDNLYDELAVMAIIRALPHSFDDVIRTISVLDKFDKQSVIQTLRNMDQTRSNLSGTSTAFYAAPASQKASQRPSQVSSMSPSPSLPSTLSSPPQSKASRPKSDFSSSLAHIEPNS